MTKELQSTAGQPWTGEAPATLEFNQAVFEGTGAGSTERNYLLLVWAGLLAVAAYVAMFITAWEVWGSKMLDPGSGIDRLLLLLLPYTAGLLLFGYAYRFNNWAAARRLALIAGGIGLAILVVFFTIWHIWKFLASSAPGFLPGGDSDSSCDSDSDSSSDSNCTDSSGSAGSSHGWWSVEAHQGSGPTSLATCPRCGQRIPGGIDGKCPHCPVPQVRAMAGGQLRSIKDPGRPRWQPAPAAVSEAVRYATAGQCGHLPSISFGRRGKEQKP